jgi:hypothetical protein
MRHPLTLSAALLLLPGLAAAGVCEARSAPQQTPLVELYTSEGCSSCPPADRWLSSLPAAPIGAGQPVVLAAAFHVSYWDRLGWPDRFASPDFTARQAALMRASGARYVYTPQVVVNGRDWRGWPTLPVAGMAPARASIALQRRGSQVQVSVAPGPGAPPQLGLWWALLEDGHGSAVSAGENRGAQLRHDHVVRQYGQLPAWPAQAAAALPPLVVPAKGEGGRQARLLVVVTDAATGAPLQAAQLVCPGAA